MFNRLPSTSASVDERPLQGAGSGSTMDQAQAPQSSTNPSMAAASSGVNGSLTEEQQAQLRAQIVAYRCLSTNQTVPARVLNIAQTRRANAANALEQAIPTRRTTMPRPTGIDPLAVLRQRELHVQGRIRSRIEELSDLPADLRVDISLQAQIELRALRLHDLQKKVCQTVAFFS